MKSAEMRALRLTNGVRVVELAKGLGITPSMVSQWESGYRPIPLDRGEQIGPVVELIAAAKRQAAALIERTFAECRALGA